MESLEKGDSFISCPEFMIFMTCLTYILTCGSQKLLNSGYQLRRENCILVPWHSPVDWVSEINKVKKLKMQENYFYGFLLISA